MSGGDRVPSLDKLEQPDKAKKEYLIAIEGNLPDAYNNLARLYLQEKKYPHAAALLIQAMNKQEKSQSIAVRVVVPFHGGKILHPKIVRQILDAIG